MDWETQAFFAIVFVLFIVVYRKREQFTFYGKFPLLYVGLLRTQIGVTAMQYLGEKWGRIIRPVALVGVVVGFMGMVLITVVILHSSFLLLTVPDQMPGVQLVLPFEAKGAFHVPALYWILSIFIIAGIHEFAHGVVARSYGMKVKSSGLAFLGALVPIVPAAFVEPDEKEVAKRPKKQQLALSAAGPFINIMASLLIVLLFAFPIGQPQLLKAVERVSPFDLTSFSETLVAVEGLNVTNVVEESPAGRAKIPNGTVIVSMNGIKVNNTHTITTLIQNLRPKQSLVLITSAGELYHLTLRQHPDNPERGYIGVNFQPIVKENPLAKERYGIVGYEIIRFFVSLLYWIFQLSLAIGLFNLLPLGPLDGGRMFLASATHFLPQPRAYAVWKYVSIALLVLLLTNLLFGII